MHRTTFRVILVASLLALTATSAVAGSYATWAKAQKAAGFKLLVPHKTYGLKLSGRIFVDPCFVTGATKKRQVFGTYGKDHHPQLSIYQTNNPYPCSNAGESTTLGHYTVRGHKATLVGFCGFPSLPSCSSKKVVYQLTWLEPHRAYIASAAGGATIKQVVAFARSWK